MAATRIDVDAQLGLSTVGAESSPLGILINNDYFVITCIDASSVGTVGGPAAPVLQIQGSLNGEAITLGGVMNESTATWEAHWVGRQVVIGPAQLFGQNVNSLSLDNVLVQVSGFVPTILS